MRKQGASAQYSPNGTLSNLDDQSPHYGYNMLYLFQKMAIDRYLSSEAKMLVI